MIFLNDLANALAAVPPAEIDKARRLIRASKRLVFIGNGGSAAIASHMAIDYTKNGGKTAIAFNDAAGLLCVGNDYGFENLFAQLLRFHAQAGDTLVAISSSGRSPNILKAVEAAQNELGMPVITLSGFDADNPLRTMGAVNFWIDSHDYGIVELTSEAILHSMIGTL